MPPSSKRQVSQGGWLIIVVGLALIAGCTTERSLNRRSVEVDIESQLFAEHPGLVAGVACPDMVEPMPGQLLTCRAQVGAQSVDVVVTLGGTIEALTSTAALDDRFIDVGDVGQMLAQTFTDEIGIATIVDCGQPVLVVAPDQAVVCTATDVSGRARLFDVQISDAGELQLSIR